MRSFFLVLCLLGFVIPTNAQPYGKLLIVSDIHFNPFADTSIIKDLVQTDYERWGDIFRSRSDSSYGKYGIDTYYPLFMSTLQAMRARIRRPDMIIINGDLLSHNFQSVYQQTTGITNIDSFHSFVRKTISFIFMMIDNYFPNAHVLPVLGNNDDYCGDYMIQPSGPFLSFYAEVCKNDFDEDVQPGFMKTFSKGGYYATPLPWNQNQVFIGLNTVFMSPKYVNKCNPSDTANPALAELKWLRTTLASCAAQKKKVWLSYHIPPGVDVFSTLYKGNPCQTNIVTTMWQPAYIDSFITLMNTYSSIINAQLAGHTHMDDQRLIGTDANVRSFVHITPAVSPIYQNNPAFEEATWNTAQMQLTNTTTYRFKGIETTGNNTWQAEYDFNKTYGTTGINAANLLKVWERLGKDTTLQNTYETYYYVTHPGQKPVPWKAYWCGMRYLTPQAFMKCNCSK